jgi:RloB-like protein
VSKPKRPSRPQANAIPKKRILVFTEGLATEPIYLTYLHRLHRERISIVIDPRHGSPLTLVESAVAERKHLQREERRGRGTGYDEYWCVFDVDEHLGLNAALELASSNGVSIALSNPCIELWFVLHSADQTAHIDRHEVQALNRQLQSDEQLRWTRCINATNHPREATRAPQSQRSSM